MPTWKRLELAGLRDVQIRTLFEKISRFLEQVNSQLNLSTAAPGTIGGGGGTMLTGPQTGFYGASPTTGTGVPLLRASAVLVYPEALGTVADRALTVTLTDGGAGTGALLTASTGFGANRLSLLPAGVSNALTIYPATVGRSSSDFAAETPGFGYVMADNMPTKHYWRLRMSSDGIPMCKDEGTALPGTT